MYTYEDFRATPNGQVTNIRNRVFKRILIVKGGLYYQEGFVKVLDNTPNKVLEFDIAAEVEARNLTTEQVKEIGHLQLNCKNCSENELLLLLEETKWQSGGPLFRYNDFIVNVADFTYEQIVGKGGDAFVEMGALCADPDSPTELIQREIERRPLSIEDGWLYCIKLSSIDPVSGSDLRELLEITKVISQGDCKKV